MKISVKELLNANLFELSKLAFSLNQKATQESFAKIGILVEDEEDLKQLALLHERKGDIKGEFKSYKGEPIIFNFEEVLENIEMNPEDVNNHKHLNLDWAA